MTISVVIPAHNEEDLLPRCLASIEQSAAHAGLPVEVVVVLNRCTDRTEEIAKAHGCLLVHEEAKNLSLIRNAGARAATGEILITIDADSAMHPRTLEAVHDRLASGRYIGGATLVVPDRLSLGICCSLLVVLLHLWRNGFGYGLFWCHRRDFEAIGGFDPDFLTVEDVDFLRRLKQHGRAQGLRFGTLWSAPMRTSSRKFDQFGDWFFVTNPGFLKRALDGHDRKAGDRFWYDARTERD